MLRISLYQIVCNWKRAFAPVRAMHFVCVAVSSCWNPKAWPPKRSVCKRKWHTSRSPMVETLRDGRYQGIGDTSRTRSKTAHGLFGWGKRYAEPLKTIGKTWRKPRKPGNKLRERKRLKTLSGLFIISTESVSLITKPANLFGSLKSSVKRSSIKRGTT